MAELTLLEEYGLRSGVGGVLVVELDEGGGERTHAVVERLERRSGAVACHSKRGVIRH